MAFKPVSPSVSFPKLEEGILEYWKKNKIFEKTLEKEAPNGEWTFLDGPPFITGLPHYGSLLSSLPKDIFPRYWTMKGYRVRRVWGWDCHGLPAENKVEQELGIKSKKEIEEKIGVKKFIEACKNYVAQVSDEWEWYVDHIGRWVDFKNAYKTMDLPYMETVMWVFKQMYDKDLIYKGLRISLYCPHCETPISNFEVAMDSENYKEVIEKASVYKYQLEDEKNTFLLAWSTTPWNKIVTPALAVNPKLTYVKVKPSSAKALKGEQGEENYILAEDTLEILQGEFETIEKLKGKDLVGKKFVPHYDFYEVEKGKKAFVVVGGDFVTSEEGTGVVTLAVYGEEDLEIMKNENIQMIFHVDDDGHIKKDVPLFGGMYYLKANKAVDEDLLERGLLYRSDNHTHTVAHCWRCGTQLFYNPQDAWYVNVQKLKSLLIKTNEKVNWFPKHFKHGRFLKSLENAPDWNISRSRYWGSPVPVWECECGERFVPGSVTELERESGQKIKDLHKPEIDEVSVKCKKCGKLVKRVPEVLDSWIEAGSASFAERHFPFEKEKEPWSFFPPDFIAEYTGQIRAWFYVLHVIGGALYESEAFKNVLVEGVILGTDGRKMSKNYGNYPDPKELLEKYGGDALRLYLSGSPVMKGEDILISEENYRNQVKGFLLLLWNVYNFLVSNSLSENWEPDEKTVSKKTIDRWIVSRLNSTILEVTKSYENYDTPRALEHSSNFLNDLSLWYVRRIRERVGPSAENSEGKKQAYQTLWFVLKEFSKLLAPLTPFTTEEIFRNLTGNESVHLESWWNLEDLKVDKVLEAEMEKAKELSSKIHSFRKEANIKVRIPLIELSYKGPSQFSGDVLDIVLSEVNVSKLNYKGKANNFSLSGDTSSKNQDLKAGEAREIIRNIQSERKRLGTGLSEKVKVWLPSWPEEFEGEIKRKALVKNLSQGDFKVERE